MDKPETIKNRLIAVRYALGYGERKQSAFAEAIGMTKSAYNAFETGDRLLTFETACLIRKRFGVSIDYLFFGDMELAARQTMMDLGPTPAVAHGKPNTEPPARSKKRVRGGSAA